MVLLTCQDISKRYPEGPVLESVSLGIHEGDRIGVIGVNGSGKSTLLRILGGLDEPDEGTVITNVGLRISFLEQQPLVVPGRTVGDVASRSRDTLALLDRMGFAAMDVPLADLSGGEKRRVALAEALAKPAELLILDEPTNHLDVDFIDWLEERLATRPGALVIVTHDRYLLDRVSNRILEVDRTEVFEHQGSYSDFLAARARRQAHTEATERKLRNTARRELEWLSRSPKARTGKAKYRVQRAEKLQDVTTTESQVAVDFTLPTARIGGKVVNLHNAGKRYDRWVVRNFTYRLAPDSRIGLVGPNGSGKTTLLGMMAGFVPVDEGKVVHGSTVRVGWYGQEPTVLAPELRLLDAVRDVALQTRLSTGVTIGASQLLERFGFPSRQHSTRIDELSGGERRRLELIRVLATAPNVLMLDEPTNDLDLDTLRTLEDLLDHWIGAVVVASHDRFFLDRVCEHLFSLEPGGAVVHHPQGWAGYRAAKEAPTPPTERASSTLAKPKTARRGLSFNDQREYSALSKRIPTIERKIAELRQRLDVAGSDWDNAHELSAQLATSLEELETAEHRWLELAEEAGQ